MVQTLTGHKQAVVHVAVSLDGQWIASGGRRATVRLWRVGDGALQQQLAEHAGDVWSVAFSPDGAWLASSSDDQTVKLFRLQRAGE